MEHRGNEAREQFEDGGRERYPGSEGEQAAEVAASRSTGARVWIPRRDGATSWVNWQSALYVFVLGWICVLLASLTSFWWLALICGTVAPIALAVLDGPGRRAKRPDNRKLKERELLGALAERGELTPTTAAMRTSLTVYEASKMLEELARKGHLKLQVEDGVMAYALCERDRRETLGEVSVSLGPESDGAPRRFEVPRQLEDPLSERELEVLALLASGRTNAEISRDLFVAVGTVKSHTNNIYRKLGAKNRPEALAKARELNLLA